jgi:aspartokinase
VSTDVRVFKFGGTSVGAAPRLAQVLRIIRDAHTQGSVVHVMRSRSVIDYVYLNLVFLARARRLRDRARHGLASRPCALVHFRGIRCRRSHNQTREMHFRRS